MKIYISGISGTAMGALALFIKQVGFDVCGSDMRSGAISSSLKEAGIDFEIGAQDGSFLKKKFDEGEVEWFLHTSALKPDHKELVLAKELGLKISKRDEIINMIIKENNLKLVGVAGTHGKSTTTAMIIWACLKLGLPISWLEGTTLGFAPAGNFDKNSKFLIYEADEFDRNFLHFFPWLSVITVVDYDHKEIYPTKEIYDEAFEQFKAQSQNLITEPYDVSNFTLAGEVRKIDAGLACNAIQKIISEAIVENIVDKSVGNSVEKIVEILNQFPGAGRRFERIGKNCYSDYAHLPEEISATMNIAKEEVQKLNLNGLVVIYEPLQNMRQYNIRDKYKDCFSGADKIFWLPSFQLRENPDLAILSPSDLIQHIDNKEIAEPAEMNSDLVGKINFYQKNNYLILLMSGGDADVWFRDSFGGDS